MHRYDLSNSEYFKYTGHDLPKFINTCTSQEVCNVILDLEKNPKKFKKIGSELKDWFNKYNGNSLIKEYIKLMKVDV